MSTTDLANITPATAATSKARRGRVRQGKARQGKARQGRVRVEAKERVGLVRYE